MQGFFAHTQVERYPEARRELASHGAARRDEASLESVAQEIYDAIAALRGAARPALPHDDDGDHPDPRLNLGPALDAACPGGAAAAVPLPH